MSPVNTALIISGILGIPLFLLVLFRNPKSPLNISFSIFLAHIVLWAFSIALFREAKTYESALWWDQMIYYCGSIVPASVLYFAYVLVNKKKPSIKATLALIASSLITAGILFIFTKTWIVEITLNDFGNSVKLGPAYFYWMAYFMFLYVFGLIMIVKKAAVSRGFDKTQLNFIFIASLMPILIGGVPNVIMPMFGNYKHIYIGPFANLVMAVVMTYAILRHRLMDIRLVIARSVSYALLVLILSIFYTGSLIVLSSSFVKVEQSPVNLIILTTLSLVMAYSFEPLRNALEKITDKIFYKGHYESQELLHDLSQTMALTPTLSNLTYKLLGIFTGEMRLSKAFFAIIREDRLYIAESKGAENGLIITQSEVERFKLENNALIFDEIAESGLKELMRKNGISVIYPLRTSDNYIGVLILGEKLSGEIYYDQDIKILEIAGPEMAVALQNAERYEEISQFNRTLQEEVDVATKDLTEANEKLKKLDLLKDEFISIASHDLRSPFATIKGYIWMAIKDIGDYSAKATNHLNIALEATEHGIGLVNDMLDVSRIESGRIELTKTKFEIGKFILEAIDEMKVVANSKKIRLTLQSEDKMDVLADKDRIHQVLINLIGNAIKFSKEEGIITISLKEDNEFVEISVKDNGIGIKKSDIEKLFIKFSRLENTPTTTPAVTGTGLGLYICKNIVELSGGRIWVESEEGSGSTFTFSLPKA